MIIACGTDFSAPATEAVQVAALLAARLGDRLQLIHVVDEVGAELTLRTEPHAAAYAPVRLQLRRAAERASELGALVDEEFIPGDAAETLALLSARAGVRLAVVSSLGQRAPARWLLGSVSERVARMSPVPVLVVRAAAPFEGWLRRERRLSVMLGADSSSSSDAALRWLSELRRLGPCDVTVAHVACAPREHARLGVEAPVDPERLHPDIERTLLRELAVKVKDLGGEGDVRFVVRQGLGRIDEDLVTLAEDAGVDLLVVGAHQRSGIDRHWHGSVSRGVLHLAAMSVASVPEDVTAGALRPAPGIRQVLAATDFSAEAARAVSLAVALVPDGGTVHLVHVLTPAMGRTPVTEMLDMRGRSPEESPEEWRQRLAEIHDRLGRLVPAKALRHGVRVAVDVLEGDVAEEVCRAAERLGVDVICLGSRGRSRLSSALLGSAAQGVLAKSRRPVLVVPPQER